MSPAELLELIARLEVAYRTELTDPERRLWLEELEGLELADVAEAVTSRIRSGSPFMPSVGEIRTGALEVHAARPRAERLALPGVEGVEMPEEVRDKLDELREAWSEHADVNDAEEAWRRAKAAILSGPRLASACPGTGKEAVRNDSGELVCSACREPLEQGHRPSRARA